MRTLRAWRPGDEDRLAAIFHAAVHRLAAGDYAPAQLAAWAPDAAVDPAAWRDRCARQPPLVCCEDDVPIGFLTLEEDGRIGMTYVDPDHARTGVMSLLMAAAKAQAAARGLRRLHAEVSFTARPFFVRHGFRVVATQEVERGGVRIGNLRMVCDLSDGGP